MINCEVNSLQSLPHGSKAHEQQKISLTAQDKP